MYKEVFFHDPDKPDCSVHALSKDALQNALEKYLNQDVGRGDDWWDDVYESAKEVGKIIGIDINNIYFSGFYSQGDGVCFDGDYSYKKQSVRKIKKHIIDEEVIRIAGQLAKIQRKNFYLLTANIVQSGRYNNEMNTNIQVYREDTNYCNDEAEDRISELLRDYMSWIYKQLNLEYDYLCSVEYFIDMAEANEWEFDEDGEMI